MINILSFISRNPDIISTDIHNETVAISIASGNYYTFTATSYEIWRKIIDPVRVGDLIAFLEESYASDQAVIKEDTLKFLAHMHDAGLIRVS